MKVAQLNDWRGEIGRVDYVFWGFLLGAIKYNIDRVLMVLVFGEPWEPLHHFRRYFPSADVFGEEDPFARGGLMLAVALPFLWAGTALTLQRLRAARLPLWLAVLFVVPVLKWVLFLLAALVPSRSPNPSDERMRRAGRWRTYWPQTRRGNVLAAVGLSSTLVLGFAWMTIHWLENYGWGLFVGYPFLLGFVAACLNQPNDSGGITESIAVAIFAVLLVAAGLLLFAIEGVLCILMAAPLAFPLGIIGGVAGHHVRASLSGRGRGELACVVALAFPVLGGVERVAGVAPAVHEVTTAVVIDAPASRVWKHVVSFSTLPPPREWIFRAGIAHPCEARIEGSGVGAVRHCVFSTGSFVEPIVVWDEPRLLEFTVTSNPPPMQEWTPYGAVHPPHLDGFLVSERGRFRLTPLADGRTRLEGTTWYRHGLWPSAYWRLWSDAIIHTIHRRVLHHIADLSGREPT